MRIHLKMSANTDAVPFSYQVALTGAVHKWLGENHLHGATSLYSFSWLRGGKASKEGLNYKYGAFWFISAYDTEVIKEIVWGIQKDPYVNFGMEVIEAELQETPSFNSEKRFMLAAPALIKKQREDGVDHILYSDTEADKLLTATMHTKLKRAGLEGLDIEVGFDRSYARSRTKLIDYKGIKNKVSLCPVVIKGDPQALAFAWDVGIGHSTGIGFGALV